MPKQNRPLVRDGRLQAKKKRTDRSYLRGNGSHVAVADEPEAASVAEDAQAPAAAEPAPPEAEDAQAEMSVAEADAAEAAEDAAVAEAMSPTGAVKAAPAAAAGPAGRSGRLPTTVRALQQQGVRKRREFDVHALAIRDTKYAIHEMRRIFILSAMVIATLIVLGVVMR